MYGRILGYQKGTTEAFYNSVSASYTSKSEYVDGVSVTHGPIGSRQHIWTFTTALYKDDPNYNPLWNCPCTNTRHSWPYQLPSFIQNNYFCDTGNLGPGYDDTVYYSSNPLWDGVGVRQIELFVNSTTLLGSTSHCHGPPQMMWKYTSVMEKDQQMRTLLSI